MTELGLSEGITLLQRRSKLLQIMLVCGLILLFMVLAGQVLELRGLVSLDDGAPVTGLNGLYLGVSVAEALLAFTTYVVFCMWTYRAAANIKASRAAGFTFTPAWTVGWHFVPIANLYKPFLAMRQIWAFSHGSDRAGIDSGHSLLIGWWGLWSFSVAVGTILSLATIDAASPAEKREVIILNIVYSCISLILYPLALRLVARVAAAQRDHLSAAHIFA